jgi:hypothetical protein
MTNQEPQTNLFIETNLDFNSDDSEISINNESDDDDNSYSDYTSSDDAEYLYDVEEPISTRYNIVLCELYNSHIHGLSNTKVIDHYLVICKFKVFNYGYINNYKNTYMSYLITNTNIHNSLCIRNEIAECVYLETNECVAIIKTIWIKLIQRTWKKIYKKKQEVLKQRRALWCLLYREIWGLWPSECLHLPKLIGMMSYLRNHNKISS